MRIPKDISLAKYIRQLIAADEVWKFYKTDDWQELQEEVMDELHHECQECLKRGEYTEAQCVHHVNHVRKRPDLALSKYFVDSKGSRQRNLLPLCNACHNKAHPEKFGGGKGKDKFTNEERW